MTEAQPSFFTNLWQRRVPQIVGVYIAAVWMMVEIGDWVIDRFDLNPDLTAYIFIGMITLLPAVVVVAYGHGAPGKDRWTRFQRVFVGANVIGAVAALVLLAPDSEPSGARTAVSPLTAAQATEMVTFTDETGQQQQIEVAREGYHKTVSAFAFNGDSTDHEWLNYGLPWLLTQDLQRNPLLSTLTPLGSSSLREKLRQKGVERGLRVPRPLALQLARERNHAAVLLGRYQTTADGVLTVIVETVDPHTGEPLGEPVTTSGTDWLALVDQLASELRRQILGAPGGQLVSVSDARVADHVSADMNAIAALVDAIASVAFDNNYQAGIELANGAVALDPTFAIAHAYLGWMYRFSGRNAEAQSAVEAALQHDYKLYSETKFLLQAERYALRGDPDRVMQSLQLLTEVHPNSAQAFEQLGRNALFLTDDLDLVESAARRVLQLDPDDHGQLLQLATVQTLRGDHEGAQTLIDQYLEVKPTDQAAWLRLAENKIRRGLLDDARAAFETVSLIDSNSLDGELGLARLEIRNGELDLARQRLTQLRPRAKTDRQQVKVLTEYTRLHATAGEIEQVIDTLRQADQLAASYEAPVNRVFSYGFTLAAYYAEIGQFENARAELDRMRNSLQAPFDRYLDYGYMDVAEKSDDREGYADALAGLKAFDQEYTNPVMQPFLLAGDAQLAVWDEDFIRSATIFSEVIEQLNSSVLSVHDIEPIEAFQLKLAQCMRMAGNFGGARSELDQILQRFPAWPEARLELAEVLVEQGQPAQAALELEGVLKAWSSAHDDYRELHRARQLEQRIDASL